MNSSPPRETALPAHKSPRQTAALSRVEYPRARAGLISRLTDRGEFPLHFALVTQALPTLARLYHGDADRLKRSLSDVRRTSSATRARELIGKFAPRDCVPRWCQRTNECRRFSRRNKDRERSPETTRREWTTSSDCKWDPGAALHLGRYCTDSNR